MVQSALTSPQAAEGSYHGLKKFAIWAFILLSLAILKALCMSIKNRFFRSVHAILGKVGRVASDEVILQLHLQRVWGSFTKNALYKFTVIIIITDPAHAVTLRGEETPGAILTKCGL